METTDLRTEFTKETKTRFNSEWLAYNDYVAWLEQRLIKLLTISPVSGSTLLPDGWKVYKCTDCQEINVKKDNRQITVGFCDNCEHPLWNDDVD